MAAEHQRKHALNLEWKMYGTHPMILIFKAKPPCSSSIAFEFQLCVRVAIHRRVSLSLSLRPVPVICSNSGNRELGNNNKTVALYLRKDQIKSVRLPLVPIYHHGTRTTTTVVQVQFPLSVSCWFCLRLRRDIHCSK